MKSLLLKTPLPFAAIIISHIIWGGNFVVAKIALQEFPVMTLAFLRFGLACLLISPFFLVERGEDAVKKTGIKLEHLPKLFLIGLTLITFNIAFFYEGLLRTSALNASVIGLIVPLVSVVGGWIFLKEKIYGINLFGIILGFFGALIIIGAPLILIGNLSPSIALGNIFLILSDVSFVIGAILAKDMFKTYSNLTVTGLAFFVGFITFAIPAFTEFGKDPQWVSKLSILGGLGLFYITILSSVCAFFLYNWGLTKVGLIKTNLFRFLEPAVVATLAVPFLGERISYSFIVGTILVILGVYWGTLGKLEHHHLHHLHHKG